MKKLFSNTSRKYKCIFFDLDHTLWDYETNAKETLQELYFRYRLDQQGILSAQALYEQFTIVNNRLWELYDRGIIGSEVIRKERFRQILVHFGANDEKLCNDLSHDYFHTCPTKGNLIPYALETLEYLSKHYSLTVVTNGFDEIQQVKLRAGNLHAYFDHVVTSQKAGCKKPAREIFQYAMNANGVKAHEVVMIGDNLITDIGGARNASIDAIFFNPEGRVHDHETTHEITCLSQLPDIL